MLELHWDDLPVGRKRKLLRIDHVGRFPGGACRTLQQFDQHRGVVQAEAAHIAGHLVGIAPIGPSRHQEIGHLERAFWLVGP